MRPHPPRHRPGPPALAAAALLMLPLAGCGGDSARSSAGADEGGASATGPAKGPPRLPRIALPGIQKMIERTAAQDRVLVLDFWATWCVPCVKMFPALHGALAKREAVRLVSITLDTPGDGEKKALSFLRRHHAREHAYMLVPEADRRLAVPETLGRKWQDLVVPAVLVYDRSGALAAEHLGGGARPVVESVEELLHGAASRPGDDA